MDNVSTLAAPYFALTDPKPMHIAAPSSLSVHAL